MPRLSCGIGILLCIIVALASCNLGEKIDYSSQVKPILNKHCLACHGGVKKQGGFSLLFQEEAFAKAESGNYPIIPGDAKNSEMFKRIISHDAEYRMPYEKEALSEDEIAILKTWIDQGAEWEDHWAYLPIERQNVPKRSGSWARSEIDDFIQQTAAEEGLQPMQMADSLSLKRRMALDIIGLPADFQGHLSTEDYIDSLLASPLYGEKWTSMWLDLARYADTKGYERDDKREIWRYRDWLIKAFNEDMPYDQFIVKQLAGDQLKNSTEQDLIATAFHRNTMTNDEGGTDNEEFRTAAVMDRVNTTWEALMGTSFACVQCHSHPYDAFKHEDYYHFMAFFNNTRDEDTYHDYPIIRHFSDSLREKMAVLEEYLGNYDEAQKDEIIQFLKTLQPSVNSIQSGKFVNAELSDTKFLGMRRKSEAILPNIDLTNVNHLIFQARSKVKTGTWNLRLDNADGKLLATYKFVTKPEDFWVWKYFEVAMDTASGIHNLHLSYDSPEFKDKVTEGVFFNWFHFTKKFPGIGDSEYASNHQLFKDLLSVSTPSTPIMMDNPREMFRPTHLFERGSWLTKGEEVEARIPGIMMASASQKYKGNRLGLATWMTSKENPLVARTMVNRVWEQVFGTGLVETLEDLGSQASTSPHHPLLDHLSYLFMTEYKWSVKQLLKAILTSATYQQDSKLTAENKALDPFNRLFARGPRVRLTGEQLRDQALWISGTLSNKMYGPPVMPFQPEGIWNAPYSGASWKISEGEDKFRRAVYTYWRRSSPYPSMMTFDGSGREVCASRRLRTNTPLQALVMMNDPAFIDLSEQWAKSLMETHKIPKDRISAAYSRACGKDISTSQMDILLALFEETKAKNMENKTSNKDETTNIDPVEAETLAMALVCNVLLNLDEVIVKS